MRAAVVVPVKAFARAKARLAPALDERARVELARRMADRVLDAARDLPVWVACDDDEVAGWATARGASVAWVPGTDLNGAVAAAVAALDVDRVVVAHADLPQAEDLTAALGTTGVVLVPDRQHDGTNVLSLPTGTGFTFRYGPGSFSSHHREAARVGLDVEVRELADLMWDVDEPSDLHLDDRLPERT